MQDLNMRKKKLKFNSMSHSLYMANNASVVKKSLSMTLWS